MTSEGGDVQRSGMSAFGEVLEDEEIWQIITYLRQLQKRLANLGLDALLGRTALLAPTVP